MTIIPFIIALLVGLMYGSRIKFQVKTAVVAAVGILMAYLIKDFPYYEPYYAWAPLDFSGIFISALAGVLAGSFIWRRK